MTDLIELVKDEADLKRFLQDEKDNAEIHRLKNWSNRNMARVILAHKFGEGDCSCNNCSRG